MNRRTFLKGLGWGAVTVAGLGGVGRAADQNVFTPGSGEAYRAWDEWAGLPGDEELGLVRAAIVAANPDNSQPWRFHVEPGRIELWLDPARQLKAIDPFLRNVHLGLGCALENLLLAAPAHGFQPTVTFFPEAGQPLLAAAVELIPVEISVPELYLAIPQRHMNRGPYDLNRPLDEGTLQRLERGGEEADLRLFWFTGKEECRTIGEAVVAATATTIADVEQAGDVDAWSRRSRQEIQEHQDGITLDAAGLAPWLLALAKLLPPLSAEQSNRSWLDSVRDVQVKTAAAFGIIAVRDRQARVQQLQAGRWLERIHLAAALEGIGLHVMHALPDRAGREEALGIEPRFGTLLQTFLGDENWQALTMFRMGYPVRTALRSPRRPAERVLF